MSAFLAGIALRGAGLYPAAKARQSPAGDAGAGWIEIVSEPLAEPAAQSPLDERATPGTAREVESDAGELVREHHWRETRLLDDAREGKPPAAIPERGLAPFPVAARRNETPLELSRQKARAGVVARESGTVKAESGKAPEQAAKEPSGSVDKMPPRRGGYQPVKAMQEAQGETRPSQSIALIKPANRNAAITMALPAAPAASTAPEPEPRPVEVRIGKVEVREAAPASQRAPSAPRTAPTAETGFGGYLRMRTYRGPTR